jgi:photosystem II stability/assembly factor-like uncharacterized protein
MSQKKKWMIVGVTTVAGLAACAPQVVNQYNQWKQERRNALIAKTEKALAEGLDYIPWMDSLREEDEAEVDGLPQEENEAEEKDDAALRRLANQAEIGPRSPEFHQHLLRLAASEARKWHGTGLGGERPSMHNGEPTAISPTPAGTATWVNLGPGSARMSYNGTYYKSIDSGRLTKIRVKPGDDKTVYIATAGGGVWKTTDFGQFPSWEPITDQLGSLAVGALDVDPVLGRTIWIGLGDPFDQQGGGLVKSTDEGATWGAPILLSAIHPVDGQPTITNNVRDISIDPLDPNNILVATNDGFYRSTDGANFNFIDLPNTAATGPVREATWSIVYLGSAGGQSQWLLSGAYACPGGQPPHPASGTQNRSFSTDKCASNPAVGNYGDIWKSVDSGATWVSARASGLLPASVTGSGATDISHIDMAASGTADPAATVVYAIGGSLNDGASATNAVLKSVDGGNTWTAVATKNTPVTNPTILAPQCTTVDVGHDQSWYNLAIGVDPADPKRVLIGGNLCGIRTIDGGATWQNVAHWLPQGGAGLTADGFLPYVHADWHTASIVRINGVFMALVGHDGGISVSYDVFDRAAGAQVSWLHPNIGLVTHLPYSVGSGDPVFGNASVVFSGLQDNGTRFRLLSDDRFIADVISQNWDQIRGGDGIGTAVARDPRGNNPVYWVSTQTQWAFCLPRLFDCSRPTRLENGVETVNYRLANLATAALPLLPAPNNTIRDSYPFMIRYSPTYDAASSVIAHTTYNLWKLTVDPVANRQTVARLTPNFIIGANSTVPRAIRGLGAHASPHTYTVDGVPARIYGVPLSGGASALVVDKGSATTVVTSTNTLQVPNESGGFHQVGFIQAVDVPRDPASLGGTDSTKTWLVASAAANTVAGILVPDAVGHLFKTTDGGATWVPFHGNGTGADLPNVPVWVVRYDPSDRTDSTIYVGTELGLYRTTDGGNTWARYGVGLPLVRVYDLNIASNGSLLRVATYGRGVWEIHPKSEPAATAGNGDWDGNGVVDYFDLAAMATRLGTTPALAPNLPYDNTLDLTSSPTTIEEADLSALLGKFGSAP